uniref:Uncharacterized protein n=1 Tax=Anguilla anguilla TaxID=7936 RepID=A0A0E9TEN2_ANGAN
MHNVALYYSATAEEFGKALYVNGVNTTFW